MPAPQDNLPRATARCGQVPEREEKLAADPGMDFAVSRCVTPPSVSEIVETGRTGKALEMIEAALREANVEREQIDRIAIGVGPGSYTGIRSAIALAQGWEVASGTTKLLVVSSAECVAAQAQAEGLTGSIAIAIDAQRNEFYLAVYEIAARSCREVKPLRLATRTEVDAERLAGNVLIGPEITHWFPEGRLVFPRAATLGQLALGRSDVVPGEKIEPIYLRETKFVKAPPPRASLT